MAVFRGIVGDEDLIASDEGQLEFVSMFELDHLPLVEDIPILLPKVMSLQIGSQPLHAHYTYIDGELIIKFNQVD